ncbi:MAG: monooxygenase [Hydrocarboniphaga sp.]|uniref:alkane 1-monooxygenase n=1 Tax=Hydrocarboniphaga sp. TaxID=2033016 RepID=UPI00262591AE|nr:alkane 1-monooxygenase [Hydrocarboniphaga sp.]MDB5971899.1 monooxygenase [Hydrocarboniphaga sp.]
MKDYLKYWVPVLVLAIAYTGILLGGDFVWLGFLMFPTLAIGDVLLGRDYSPRHMKNEFVADIPLWVCTVGPILMYWVFAWQVSRGAFPEVSQMIGGVLSLAWTSIVPLAPAAHEMYHKRSVLARTMGRYAQLCQLDPMRDIAHVVGHHIDVATVKDGDTAKRGTSLYAFVGHAVWEQTLRDVTMESDALRKRGLSAFNYRHRIYRAVLAQGVFQGGSYLLAGWHGVALTFGAVLVARFWAEAFNYFQHYGLIRVVGTTIGRRHLWNHLHWFSRVLSFEITNHADHHLNSYQRYYQLVPHKGAIEMPSLFVCFIASLIPPLWHEKIVKPALKRWDLEFATPEEQVLAAAANRAAGWPDWINEREAQASGPRVRATTQGC